MKLWFLPYVREGLRPSADGHSATVPWRAQARVDTRVASAGKPPHDAATHFDLLGPGDIVGIDPAQLLRVLPAGDTNRAEPEFFPAVEFDAPDLPWVYSPMVPTGNRLMPWICLVVVEEQAGVGLQRGGRGQSPWILSLTPERAAHELPDLTEAWAWAHVQVTCQEQAEIRDTLATRPDRTLSRLLAPRRLLPQRRYLACVVPTFLAGLLSGLGGDPESDATRIGQALAWRAGDLPVQLPVYFTWRFSTGEAGDIESMLRRLRPAPVDPAARRHLTARLVRGDAPQVVDWRPALRVSQEPTSDPRPASIVAGIRAALAPSPGDGPLVGPPYLGEPWVFGHPLDPISGWAPALNLTPMARAAAALGGDLVRDRQEEIVAAVWEQLDAYREEDRQRRARQLVTVVENQVKERLQAAPLEEASRVLGPVVAQRAADANSVGLRTAVGRRVTHKSWRVTPASLSGALGVAGGGLTTAAPPPVADRQALLAPGDASYQPSSFAPRLPEPLAELVDDRVRELLLPSTAEIAPDSVLAVEVDRSFVEAFLVGANQELNRELLWRGLPADRRATAFRRFWNRTDGNDDIPAISGWAPMAGLGDNAAAMDAGLLFRSELVHRCPSLFVAAVPAVRAADGTRRPSGDAAALRPAVIRTIIGDDLLYVGFAGLTLAAMIGDPGPAGAPGWFVMLAENPVDPRFGLDPPVTPAPTPARGDLSWSNVPMAAGEVYARAGKLPPIPAIDFSAARADSARIAYVVQQRQFRVFLHASVLARPGRT